MKINRKRICSGIAVLLLMAGLLNYFFFQSNIALFSYLNIDLINNRPVPVFLTGYFSDLCWCAALYLCVIVLSEKNALASAGRMTLLLLPFITEVVQFLGLMNGTPDSLDLLLYLVVLSVFTLIFPHQILSDMIRNKIRRQLYPAIILVIFFATAIASTTAKQSYQSKPIPCTTHAPMTVSPVLIRVYISGSYTMKDLSGAQVSGRDYLIKSLNKYAYNKYQLADGVNPHGSFSITINEYSGYYGAEVYFTFMDGNCKSNGKYFNNCQSYSRFETTYITPQKLYEDIAAKYDNYIRNGWCLNCPDACNPY